VGIYCFERSESSEFGKAANSTTPIARARAGVFFTSFLNGICTAIFGFGTGETFLERGPRRHSEGAVTAPFGMARQPPSGDLVQGLSQGLWFNLTITRE
jgi:hypothetical protein